MTARLKPGVIKSSRAEALRFGVIKVRELLARRKSPQMSVALIELDGTNEAVKNKDCDAAYYVLEGNGTFTVGEGEKLDVYNVGKGDLVVIPKGTFYQDSGKMTMLSFCTPAFAPEQVERTGKRS